METLAEDLLLLAVRPNGKLGAAPKLRFGLSGSELVRLAAHSLGSNFLDFTGASAASAIR